MNTEKKYDIVVAGAGIAGCAAALAAARRGHRTALIERQTLIGGLATSGMILHYLPLCDGCGHQVTFGLAEELLKRSLQFSPFDLPVCWGGSGQKTTSRPDRYEALFSPAGFVLALDEVLLEAGVDLWLDTQIGQVFTDSENTVQAVEAVNVSGQTTISAQCFVDATGSASIVHGAGGRVEKEENILSVWFMQNCPLPEENKRYNLCGNLHIKSLNATWEKVSDNGATSGKNTTAYTRQCWAEIRKYYQESYSAASDRFTHFPVSLPAMADFRKIAAAAGKEKITGDDELKRRESSVAIAADWRKPGPVWETPFGALVPEKIRGVFTAGRCIDATGDGWEIFRVIPACAATGEAAGIAASLTLEKNCNTHDLAYQDVQQQLRQLNIPLHIDEVIQ